MTASIHQLRPRDLAHVICDIANTRALLKVEEARFDAAAGEAAAEWAISDDLAKLDAQLVALRAEANAMVKARCGFDVSELMEFGL